MKKLISANITHLIVTAIAVVLLLPAASFADETRGTLQVPRQIDTTAVTVEILNDSGDTLGRVTISDIPEDMSVGEQRALIAELLNQARAAIFSGSDDSGIIGMESKDCGRTFPCSTTQGPATCISCDGSSPACSCKTVLARPGRGLARN